MVNRKKVTLHDVAAALELTAHTVSRALRGLPGMSEDTRRAVLSKARELGYRTKEAERSMAAERIPLYAAQQRRFLFFFNSRMEHQLHINHLIHKGLQQRLHELGHQLGVAMLPTPFEPRRLKAWLDEQQLEFAGGLFIPPGLAPEAEATLLALPHPRVLIGFPSADAKADSVVWDVAHAVGLSVKHLLAKGHERILYVGRTEFPRGFRYRWHAFEDAMREAGFPDERIWRAAAPDGADPASGERFVAELERLRPTALLCAVNEDLNAVYYACSRAHKRIPEDYSLVGLETVQTHFIAGLTHPLLCIEESGARAVDRMLWRLANPGLPFEHTRLQGGFYEGGTVLETRPGLRSGE